MFFFERDCKSFYEFECRFFLVDFGVKYRFILLVWVYFRGFIYKNEMGVCDFKVWCYFELVDYLFWFYERVLNFVG